MSKKNSKKTVPELRFRGFTDPWEQRQLGEVAERTGSGGTPSSSDPRYYGGSIPFLGIGDITGRFVDTTQKTLTKEGLENSAAWVVPQGAISLAMYASYGKSAILSRPMATSQAFFNVVFSSDATRDFIYSRFQCAEVRHEWDAMVSTGTQPNLSGGKLKKWEVSLPPQPEQRLIGRFFSTLDSLIAAAERQEALLRQKKQAYLQLIFPREGETEPRLRFAGFSGEWETQRFGEIFQYERPDAYLADDDEIEDEGAIPVLTANKAFILGYTNSLQGIYRKGRCIIFDDFTLDSKRVDQPFKVRSSAIKILTVRENEDFDFAFELLRTSKFPLLGHARHYIAVVQPQATLIPHSLQEQQHIGRFFRNFDSLIACAEKRVASLRTLKSAYLQRMFV